jgi:sugar/nucleoside kinase (ribokinase family)
LNVLVAGFMTIDRIELPVGTITSVGGPPSYAGILCARFGLDVMAATRIGLDFPDDQLIWLARNGLQLRAIDRSKTKKTTRFRLVVKGEDRTLYIVERCEDITLEQIPEIHFNASLVSPLAQEISGEVFNAIRERSDFCFLDPQGFVRNFDGSGKVTVKTWNSERVLSAIDALKMDRQEAEAITGKTDAKAALSKLSKRGVRKAIVTQGADSSYVLDGNKIYEIVVPKVKVVDSTGAGDVLSGGLITCYLRSRDFLWSCCFGIAASSLSLNSIALAKVDLPRSVDPEARRLYSSALVVETA